MSEKLKASSFHEKLMPFFSFECLPCTHALKDIVDRFSHFINSESSPTKTIPNFFNPDVGEAEGLFIS